MRKNLDIYNLSEQIGINPERLNEWIRQMRTFSSKTEALEAKRASSPYRLVAPPFLSLASITNQPKLKRGRRMILNKPFLTTEMQHTYRISKKC
ncbi:MULTISPECIES: hypothetical protein [unclassified Paenibacillus]|uniref:hypothetical protein n=1 Tax=unclassified Paenibacillus TaxID=185978 RepID=UPI000FE19898|nr:MULTISPECIES: hypothetical protein [unclassified Paenibacillus]MCM3174367.1 hypothetical protein [Paenibacillus sp. MER 99-2]